MTELRAVTPSGMGQQPGLLCPSLLLYTMFSSGAALNFRQPVTSLS